MKKSAEYTIKFTGQRVVDRYRGGKTMGSVFTVTKFIASDNDVTTYEVMLSRIADTCTCPVGRRSNCKHREMVRKWNHEQGDLFE
jgi:hypothetical protein